MLAWFLIPVALAGRVERLTELQTAGEDAEVLATVEKWEKGDLGEDAAAIRAIRDRSALKLALAQDTTAALTQFRKTYPDSTLLAEALKTEWEYAFADAQAEATAKAMRTYVAAYPDSPFRKQAEALEAGFAFQEAVAVGTPAAMAAFADAYPDSPYVATAWEALAVRSPGIYLRVSDGTARALEGLPVVDGHTDFPSARVNAPALPVVAVNVPGTGRGETSEWWSLQVLQNDGTLGGEPPLARQLRAATNAEPPPLLELSALPGTHTARVASLAEPLVGPGACEGSVRFAFVLKSADGTSKAWPFVVDCAAPPPLDAAVPTLLSAIHLAEEGNLAEATKLWDQGAAMPDGGRILAWMKTFAPDPREALVVRRPAAADVLVWDGTTTAWWHPTADGPVALARRAGLWIADGAHLWHWDEAREPWTAPAGKGCAAGTGDRPLVTLVDAVGEERVPVPFENAPRGGTLVPRQYAAGTLAVLETSANTGCGKPGDPVPRTVRLPGDRTAVLPPEWATPLTTGVAGFSVVTEGSWRAYQAFAASGPEVAAVAPAVTVPAAPGP